MSEIRKIRIEGCVAYVPLTKGLEAVIDIGDIHLVDGFNWNAHIQTHTAYARRTATSGAKSYTVYMHRVILGLGDGSEVDHRDGNGLDNRRENLREASRSQNNQNRSRKASSGLSGTCFHRLSGKWEAKVQKDGKSIYLGLFSSAEQAQ